MHATYVSIKARSGVAIFSQSRAGIVEFETHCEPISPTDFFAGSVVEYGAMSKQVGSIARVTALLIAGAGLHANTALAAEECLGAPSARAPQGSHWYFRTDRTTHQKCWYVRAQGQAAQQLAPQDTTEAAPAAKPVSAPAPAVAATGAATGDSAQMAAQDIGSQQSAQQARATPSATVKWPNPASLVGALKREAPAAASEKTQADAPRQQPVADTQGADGPQANTRNADPGPVTDKGPAADHEPGELAAASSTPSPLGIFLAVAMALAMAGILSRAVMKIAAARRHRVYVDRGEQDWLETIPPEQAPSIAARPVDLAGAPAERVDRSENELETALRRFMRERDRRAA